MSTKISPQAPNIKAAISASFLLFSTSANAENGIFDVPKEAIGWVKISTTQVWRSGSLLKNSSQITTPIFSAGEEFYVSSSECEISLMKEICPIDISPSGKSCTVQNSSGQSVLRIDDTSASVGQDVVTKFVHCQQVRLTPILAKIALLR